MGNTFSTQDGTIEAQLQDIFGTAQTDIAFKTTNDASSDPSSLVVTDVRTTAPKYIQRDAAARIIQALTRGSNVRCSFELAQMKRLHSFECNFVLRDILEAQEQAKLHAEADAAKKLQLLQLQYQKPFSFYIPSYIPEFMYGTFLNEYKQIKQATAATAAAAAATAAVIHGTANQERIKDLKDKRIKALLTAEQIEVLKQEIYKLQDALKAADAKAADAQAAATAVIQEKENNFDLLLDLDLFNATIRKASRSRPHQCQRQQKFNEYNDITNYEFVRYC